LEVTFAFTESVVKKCRQIGGGKPMAFNVTTKPLDLDDVACAEAIAHGVSIVIASDVQCTVGLAAMLVTLALPGRWR
jgi:hypothetical protein